LCKSNEASTANMSKSRKQEERKLGNARIAIVISWRTYTAAMTDGCADPKLRQDCAIIRSDVDREDFRNNNICVKEIEIRDGGALETAGRPLYWLW